MITRIVKMQFKSSCVANFIQLFEDKKDKIVAFDGCYSVKLLQDLTNPNIFFTYSEWESETHLNSYRHSPFFQNTWAVTKTYFDAKPEAWSTQTPAPNSN